METRAAYGLDAVEIRPECLVRFVDGWQPPNGLELRAALSMAGWNCEEFARCIGVTGRSVRRWVLNECPIPFAAWCILAAKAGFGNLWV